MIRKLYEQLARVINQIVEVINSGAAGAVLSVFGRIGAVVAQTGDYTVAQVTGAAPLASPALTGIPTAPTAAPGTNTTQLATTAFVQAAGFPAFVTPVNRTAQVANVAAANLLAVTVAGIYLVTVDLIVSQAASVSSTLPDSRIIYTDQDSGATITVPVTSGLTGNTTSTFAQATFVVNAKAGTNIQYDIGQVTPYASAGGTPMQFVYRARAVQLG